MPEPVRVHRDTLGNTLSAAVSDDDVDGSFMDEVGIIPDLVVIRWSRYCYLAILAWRRLLVNFQLAVLVRCG